MSRALRIFGVLLMLALLVMPGRPGTAQMLPISFERGDILVSLEPGPIQWRRADGSLRSILVSTVHGTGEGMAFDSSGNLYVTRWTVDPWQMTGNAVEKYNTLGLSQGAVGSGYNCDPHAIVFDAAGNAYVGQAGCNASILKFGPTWLQAAEFPVAPDNMGAFWIDLAPDGCTMFYTSWGPNVKRFDVCAGVQLPDFNAASLPGAELHDLRVLPDGGVLVSSGEVIARLNASGVLVQTYQAPDEGVLWAGLDLLGDGTFWAANYETSNLFRFRLDNGDVISSFNAGTPGHTVVAIRVKK
jgi:hypothetical protein